MVSKNQELSILEQNITVSSVQQMLSHTGGVHTTLLGADFLVRSESTDEIVVYPGINFQ